MVGHAWAMQYIKRAAFIELCHGMNIYSRSKRNGAEKNLARPLSGGQDGMHLQRSGGVLYNRVVQIGHDEMFAQFAMHDIVGVIHY